MAEAPKRMKLSAEQTKLMNEVVREASPDVRVAAEQIGSGEVVPDEDANAVVDALCDVMLGDDGYSEQEGLTVLGNQISDMIGIVQQMSEHFYD